MQNTTTLLIEVRDTVPVTIDCDLIISNLKCLGIVRDVRHCSVKVMLGSLEDLTKLLQRPLRSRYPGKQNAINEWKKAIAEADAEEARGRELAPLRGAMLAAEGKK
ncbi:MAG: hypothetical protein L6R30_09625 [Thermoanaerobaculia bacterium]|nr:hypothetical protein [Thermoanaerobaculia bacterium]